MGQIWRADHHNPTTNIQIREACEWTQMFTCGRQHYKKCAKILKFAKKTRGNLFCLCWNFSFTPFIRGPQTPSPAVFLQPVAMFKGSHVFSVKSFFSIKHWSGFSEKCLASLSVLQHSKNKYSALMFSNIPLLHTVHYVVMNSNTLPQLKLI